MYKFVQLGLFTDIKPKKKRFRYKVPTYTKFYSIYQYDREKFKNLINERKKGLNKLTQAEILEQCFIRDKNGNKLKDSDELCIFRIGTLHKIHEAIYNLIDIDFNINDTLFYILFLLQLSHRTEFEYKDLKIFTDEEQAEIINTWQLPIYDRLKLHIKYLRKIKKRA